MADDAMVCERCGHVGHADDFEPVGPDDKLLCEECRSGEGATEALLVSSLVAVGEYAHDSGAPVLDRMHEWAADEGLNPREETYSEAFDRLYVKLRRASREARAV